MRKSKRYRRDIGIVGKLTRRPLRELWRSEPEFTRWLVDNLDVLSDLIDVTLQDPKRERHSGDFYVDLVAEDEEGNRVIIENQLKKSDHDHLGKVVTHVAALEAKSAIWIVSHPRPEHIRATTWLSESGLADFYLLKVEAIKIGTSDLAPLLTLITHPSEETRKVGDTKKELEGRDKLRKHFWETLLKRAKQKTRLHETYLPQPLFVYLDGRRESRARFSLQHYPA